MAFVDFSLLTMGKQRVIIIKSNIIVFEIENT